MRRAAGFACVVVVAGCSLLPRAGDPSRLVDTDPRVVDCGIAVPEMWMAFPMVKASDYSRHFPGWSAGAEELEVADPALVILGKALPALEVEGALYELCIAVGPPDDAIVHHYGFTRFEGVRPDLSGPVVPMP